MADRFTLANTAAVKDDWSSGVDGNSLVPKLIPEACYRQEMNTAVMTLPPLLKVYLY